jgi:glutathione synthase/RimK-type ligase-like ATP-grasp enzyme
MLIGIHHTPGSFSDRWIQYCNSRNVQFKLVNCYKTDIIEQLKDCNAFFWHFHQNSAKDFLFAKALLAALELSGKKVFPDLNTSWHFDDKVAQKYLLESLGVELVPSFIFYDRNDALEWASKASFPKVFKLRGGAGSENVRLVKNCRGAARLIRTAFGKGFRQYDAVSNLRERYRKYRAGMLDIKDIAKGVARLFMSPAFDKIMGRERGYVYFQEFIPANKFDIRVVVIDQKAFAIKRLVRENDFRASGSGFIQYEKENFSDEIIAKSFEIANKTQSKCIAIDYVRKENQWLVVEISYGFSPKGYDRCIGYWDNTLVFHEGRFNPYGWMIEGVLQSIK